MAPDCDERRKGGLRPAADRLRRGYPRRRPGRHGPSPDASGDSLGADGSGLLQDRRYEDGALFRSGRARPGDHVVGYWSIQRTESLE